MAVEPDSVAFIQWTDVRGNLTGVYQEVHVTDRLTVASFNAPFSGIRNGSSVTLTFSQLFTSNSIAGTLQGRKLTLLFPTSKGVLRKTVFTAGSADDYNRAVLNLRRQVDILNALQARRQAVLDAWTRLRDKRNRISELAARLERSTESAGDILKNMAELLAEMRQKFEEIQQSASKPLTCYERGRLEFRAGSIEYTYGRIEYGANRWGYRRNVALGVLNALAQAIHGIRIDLENLRIAIASDPTKTVPNPERYMKTITDAVNAAVTEAQEQMRSTTAEIQRVQSQVDGYDRQGRSVMRQAKEFVGSLTCKD